MKKLSIVIPTFNEADNIIPLLKEIEAKMSPYGNIEIIVVDDNSADNTHGIIRSYINENDKYFIKVINRTWNKGLSSAVIEGSALANYDYVAVMDGDGQHDPNDLNELFNEMLLNKNDLIIGSRFFSHDQSTPLSKNRNALSKIGNFLIRKILKKDLTDPLSGFFIVKTRLITESSKKLYKEGFKILFDLLMINKDLTLSERQINFRERNHGASKLNFSVFLSLIGQILENYSSRIFPSSFFVFSFIGAFGVLIHLSVLYLLLMASLSYLISNFIGTICALTSNYFLNNFLTFNNIHKSWHERFIGLGRYSLVNSLSIFANIGIAAQLYNEKFSILFSTIIGILAGLVLNYLLSKNIVFKN